MSESEGRQANGRFPSGKGAGRGGKAQGKGIGGEANGLGWGGSASGPDAPYSATRQPTPEAKSAGHAEAKTAAEAAKPHAARMVDIWLRIAEDPEAPAMARINAAEKIVDRAEGKARQSIEESGPGGGPKVTEVVYRWADEPQEDTLQ